MKVGACGLNEWGEFAHGCRQSRSRILGGGHESSNEENGFWMNASFNTDNAFRRDDSQLKKTFVHTRMLLDKAREAFVQGNCTCRSA